MAKSNCKSLSGEEKTSLLDNCYSELDERYYGKTGNLIFILSEILKMIWVLYKFLAFLMILGSAIFFIRAANGFIYNSVSEAIKRSGRISLIKTIALPKNNIETTIVASRFDGNGQRQVRNWTRIWPKYGYFKQQSCDFHIDKNNFPENSIIYINQGYLTVKHNKNMFYTG